MIKRDISNEFILLLTEYPVVTVLGPRQAGKTTLAKGLLDEYQYCNLEAPETRELATDDPKGFLAQLKDKVILDEIQRLPELLSYIQVIVDDSPRNGQFVLTGSHQFAMREAIGQSLAGRTSILNLYPFSINEFPPPTSHSKMLRSISSRVSCHAYTTITSGQPKPTPTTIKLTLNAMCANLST